MRKLASILLLVCLSFLLLGYHLVFHLQLVRAKSEMKAFLKDQKQQKDVIVFSFTKKQAADLEWEEDHEFRFNNDMYDVIEKAWKGDQLVIRCIADKNETALIEHYRKQNEQNNSTSSVIQLVTATFVLPEEQILDRPEKVIKTHFHDLSFSVTHLPSSVFIPPPDAG